MTGARLAAAAAIAAFAATAATADGLAAKRGGEGQLVRDVRDMRGSVLFVNAQSRVDPSAGLDRAIAALDAEFRYDIRRTEAGREVAPQDAPAVRKGIKATVAVFVVDRADMPALAAFPDERVAFLNVAPLATEGLAPARLARRIRFGALRAFAFAFGAGFSQYDALLMSPVDSPVELDVLPPKSFLPFDTALVIRRIAASRGLAPYRMEFYETACREGWAPTPTNDVQKAIWEQVKADKERGPTNPIKIEPPGKKK